MSNPGSELLIAVEHVQTGLTIGEPHAGVTALTVMPAAAPAVIQHVPPVYFLWIPMLTGIFLAVVLVGLTGAIGVPYPEAETRTARLWNSARRKFWTSRFYASAAWTFADSWATNITALATATGVLLAAGGTLQSTFTGLDLNPFVIMNVACGGIVASAPLLFGIVNVMYLRRCPSAPADASVTLTQDATLVVPAGASIAVAGGATIETAPGRQSALVKAGGTIPAPPGSTITIRREAFMGLPSGTAVAVGPGGTITISDHTWIAANDLAAAYEPPANGPRRTLRLRHQAAHLPPADTPVNSGTEITVTGGATITVVGTADMKLLQGTTLTAPGRPATTLSADTSIVIPSDSNVLAADMRSLLLAAALTTFGTGTEIGLVAVLAIHFSGATSAARAAAWAITALVATGLVL